MIKRTLCAILTAVFLSVLCIPCGAMGTERAYPGFSDVAEGSASYEAIKLCFERGLMNGTSETTFHPQGKLTIAQLVVLAARLYDLQNGGNGTVPDLPDLSQSYLRFYDRDGSLIASCSRVWELPACNLFPNPYFAITTEEDADIPETCTLEVGFQDYGSIRRYEGGARESHHAVGGAMNQGFIGTGYRFTGLTDLDMGRISALPREELIERLKGSWWFSSAFYLATQAGVGIEGELDYRASGGDTEDSYDPLTRFSSDHASRALFAWLVDRAAGDLPVLNETVSVPDVDPNETQDGESILRLYQAGILTGVDKAGNFNGSGELTRAQAAMMLARVLDPSLRVKTP